MVTDTKLWMGRSILWSKLYWPWSSKITFQIRFWWTFKWYTPAIGISQLEYLSDIHSPDNKKYLFVSSLRAGSIYIYKLNDSFDKILEEDRIYFHAKRIRDIKYDADNKVFFIIFEFTPSIAVLKFCNNICNIFNNIYFY